MRILFVVADLFFSEPLGVMLLGAIARQYGHQPRLLALTRHRLTDTLREFDPDVVAYSAMTPDEHLFVQADAVVRRHQQWRGRRVFRIMGGAHATFFPEVLGKLDLDAVCIGEGDLLLPRLLAALENDRPLDGIPNLLLPGQTDCVKELPQNLDAIPFPDRTLLYQADPDLQAQGIRSFLSQRGCPHRCTYCFNHAYNMLFKGPGNKLLRRRSVDNLIEELKEVKERFPTMRFVRFADDVFVLRQDAWLEEFAQRYPREVGVPFYCLIRCNSLTDEVGRILSQAGCRSISMSIESGSEEVRNKVLHRKMNDDMVRGAFAIARKYRLNAYANTILGIPGTTLEDDYRSFLFAREVAPAFPTFTIFSPFPKTALTNHAIAIGALDPQIDYATITSFESSSLTGYSPQEKRRQTNLLYLSQIFCFMPDVVLKGLPWLLSLPLSRFYRLLYSLSFTWLASSRIFPGAGPRDVRSIVKAVARAIKAVYFPNDKRQILE
ncbi:MAG: B12-binding domain-containing radical SAM protein [Magnetococcales bacterium]|nr:B12-binding domain-containing radical SAM protein [Magnetococcales bacterium]